MAETDAPTRLPLLMLGALGVVFGDIGTSPLYALRTILGESDRLTTETVYGLTSTLLWSIVVVVTVLYVGLLMRVDNEGEGGLLALVALVRRTADTKRTVVAVSVLGMLGAALFLGDCVITPAISVLSAAEGLEVASPGLKPAVLPIALVVLLGVFVLQRAGSGVIGRVYGPVMVVWFAVLGIGGAVSLAQDPGAVQALSPVWAVRLFLHDPVMAFLALGSVILVVTGAEALYADLGHFGRRAIASTWLLLVLPVLVLAYLGEASAVEQHHSAAANPFYAVVPGWGTYPVLVIATMATVIASEAVIAGAFTVLHQAAGLGLFPYLRVRHTSAHHPGQIYLPAANWALASGVLVVVLLFRSSAGLSAAYGVAVSGTILVTTTLYLVLQRARNGRTTWRAAVAAVCWLVVLAFVLATLPKLASGGWAPVGLAVVLFVVMWTWWSGQHRLRRARAHLETDPEQALADLAGETGSLPRSSGSAVFLTSSRDVAPIALATVVEAGWEMAERVVLLSWDVQDTPRAPAHGTRVEVDTCGDHFPGVLAVHVTLGYRERLDVERVLASACEQEPEAMEGVDADEAWYFVSDPLPRITRGRRGEAMALWRQRVFLVVDRLATDRVEQLELPRDRTIVIGREFAL